MKIINYCNENRNRYKNVVNTSSDTQLLDLLWEDVIISHILPYLTLQDVFNFRSASKTCYNITNGYFAKMKALKLLQARPSKSTFYVFRENCKQLSTISITRTMAVTDDLLQPMLAENKSCLSSLILSNCTNLSARCLQPVILHSSKLTTLKLSKCSWMTSGALDAIVLHRSELTTVDLSYCNNISECSIQKFIKKFRELQVLSLQGNKQVSDKTMISISKYSRNLRLLNVAQCIAITDRGIRSLALNCNKLEGVLTIGCIKVTASSRLLLKQRQMR